MDGGWAVLLCGGALRVPFDAFDIRDSAIA
jgi:hypothetical protein